MPQPPVMEGVKLLIKEWMVSYGPTFSAMDCRRKFEEIEARATQEESGVIYPIYHHKTYQLIMRKFKEDDIYTKGKSYDFHSSFRYSTSIGDGRFQVQLQHTTYAMQVADYYLISFGEPCSVGLVKQYVKVCLTDPEWTNVQQKALYAEIFWVHQILKDVVGADPGSVEYEELSLTMRLHNISAGRQIFDFETAEMRFEENARYARFRSIVEQRGLKPWSATKRTARQYIGFMPQFNAAQGKTVGQLLQPAEPTRYDMGTDEFENMRRIASLPIDVVNRLLPKMRKVQPDEQESLISQAVSDYYKGRSVDEMQMRAMEEKLRLRFAPPKRQ